jgi:drug/metabolite transporter (DMT)-like permease
MARAGIERPARGLQLPASGLLLLAALTLFWGMNWPFMKIALQDIPPWTFRTLCLFGGGGLLLALTALRGQPASLPARVLPVMAVVALFNITGWHLFSAYGVLHTDSGRASIIGYTMPLWAVGLSVLILHARIGWHELAALGFGVAALLLLIGHDLAQIGASPLGALLMAGAAISWAIGTVLIKRFAPWPIPITALTGWQLLIGGLPVLIGMLLIEPLPAPASWGWAAILSTLYSIVIAMVFCHTAYFKLVELLPAHVAAISMLGTPVVGVISGALVLAEVVGPAEIGALLLVTLGLLLLLRRRAG